MTYPVNRLSKHHCPFMAVVIFSLVVSGCSRIVLTATDGIVCLDGTTELRVYLEKTLFPGTGRPVPDKSVTFLANGLPIGEAMTTDEGRAAISCRIPDQHCARFAAIASVRNHDVKAQGQLFRWTRDQTIIVVDIDGTISDTKYDDLLLEHRDDESVPIALSQKTLNQLSEDFFIVYLTARTRLLAEKTRCWLTEHDYPAGPLFVLSGVRQAIDRRREKRRILRTLRRTWPNIRIGIGDTSRDAQAYVANKMLTIIIGHEPSDDFNDNTIQLRNWKTVSQFFSANGDLLKDPDQLGAIIDQGGFLRMPIYPWKSES